ncbi:MAG TPA: hypothetical protein V6C81_04525 [Planktothrix sp.]|jgi:hypothetical protein
MAKVITAIFTAQSRALQAVEDLIAHDYPERDISLLMSETTPGRHFAMTEATKAPEGLAAGAAILGIIGALFFGFTSVGLIAIPGMNMYLSGQFLGALFGFGFGALLGGIIGGLIGLAMPEHEVEFFGKAAKDHGILLGVLSGNNDRTTEALKLIESNGAQHVRMNNVSEADFKRAKREEAA